MYLSLNGITIPNNSYVDTNEIGSFVLDGLICHTNRPASGGNSGGNWYSPTGEQISLQFDSDQLLTQYKAPLTVALYRTSTTPPPVGIYYCVINDSQSIEHTLYVGLYNGESEGGWS